MSSTEEIAQWWVEGAMDIDYDAEVPCEPEGIECDVPATWLWHHCCQSATYCDTHHAHMLKFAERYHPANVRHQCSYCFTDPMPRPTWRPI